MSESYCTPTKARSNTLLEIPACIARARKPVIQSAKPDCVAVGTTVLDACESAGRRVGRSELRGALTARSVSAFRLTTPSANARLTGRMGSVTGSANPTDPIKARKVVIAVSRMVVFLLPVSVFRICHQPSAIVSICEAIKSGPSDLLPPD